MDWNNLIKHSNKRKMEENLVAELVKSVKLSGRNSGVIPSLSADDAMNEIAIHSIPELKLFKFQPYDIFENICDTLSEKIRNENLHDFILPPINDEISMHIDNLRIMGEKTMLFNGDYCYTLKRHLPDVINLFKSDIIHKEGLIRLTFCLRHSSGTEAILQKIIDFYAPNKFEKIILPNGGVYKGCGTMQMFLFRCLY